MFNGEEQDYPDGFYPPDSVHHDSFDPSDDCSSALLEDFDNWDFITSFNRIQDKVPEQISGPSDEAPASESLAIATIAIMRLANKSNIKLSESIILKLEEERNKQ